MSNTCQLYNKANKMRITLLLFIDKEIRIRKENLYKNSSNTFSVKKEIKEDQVIYIKLEETFSNENSLQNNPQFSNKINLYNFFTPSTSTVSNISHHNYKISNGNTEKFSNSRPKIKTYDNKFNIRWNSKNYIAKHFFQRDSTICFELNTNKLKALNYKKYLLNLVNNLKIRKKQKYSRKSTNKIYKRKK